MPHRQMPMPLMEVETLSRERGSAHPTTGEGAHPAEGEEVSRLTDLLAQACESTGLQEKDAAITQGYDPKYWPRIKNGEKQAHLDRIARLPLRTQQEFVARYARLLRMHVTTEDRRRAALLEVLEVVARATREIA